MRQPWFRLVCGCATLAVYFCAARAAASVALIEDGRAACTIVRGTDDESAKVYSTRFADFTYVEPARVLHDAADDLAAHLNEMGRIWRSRDQVAVVDSPARARTASRILLGSAAIETYDLWGEAAALSYPAYTLRVEGNDLLIFGSSSKGTANGVYGFLQNEHGVRWFGPQDLFTVVPRRDNVVFDGLDRTVTPSFPGRLAHLAGAIEHPVCTWGRRRMRMTEARDDAEPFFNTSHNLHRIFDVDRYYAEHPEYYAQRNGGRPKSRQKNFGVCYSNPDVVDIAVDAALTFFRADPRHHTFSLGINDGRAYCECPDCAGLQPKRMFRGQSVASDMYYHFVNAVARRVAEEFPDRYLGAIAYNDVTAPPLGPIEKNVHVVLVSDVSEYFDPEYRAREDELVAEWEAKGITLGLYYYTQLAKLTPAYFPRLLGSELKEKHRRGFTSVTSETGQGWPWHGPMTYVELRLLWDVDLDVDALLDEYFASLYGPAAPHMQALYDLFEEIHMRPRHGGFLGEHYSFAQFDPYTAGDLEKIEQYLALAHNAIEGDGARPAGRRSLEARRVAYVSNGLKVFRAMLEGLVLADELADANDAVDNVTVLRNLDVIRRINTILREHETLYRETIINDRFLPSRFTVDTCAPVRNQWKSRLAAAVADRLAALQGAVRSADIELDRRVLDRLEDSTRRYCADPLRRLTLLVKSGAAELGPNLAPNPGFENVWGEGRYADIPEGEEWREGIAHGWGISPGALDAGGEVGTVVYEPAHPRLGRRSGRMRQLAARTYYVRGVPGIQAGDAYLCRVEARLSQPAGRIESTARVYMQVRWRGPEGWIREPSFIDELHQTGAWTQLETVAMAPPGANQAAVFLFVINLGDEQEVRFDNVSVQRIQEPARAASEG